MELEDDEDGSCSTEFGINRKSALLDLEFFDMCNGALLPDVMHDVLEGALQYELKLLLQYCINDRRFFQVSVYIFSMCDSQISRWATTLRLFYVLYHNMRLSHLNVHS